ncbi:hypothetical protein WICANDRAFT_60428 [Wickerhamomyces anomalus NRRL Y-366-8]|uniref:Uncharacterized protein n=1 Tax=Wickerhamomyces anomalus (strain ATCC 58044 / CBS 1984 / NCYC 433 / NRRL Y-366-8) TaxID=683960 RepID=A0A1E3PAH4_WICAA|nr:uncharacterized protein WICANDRAFT_60428 [Wickerhamomyces anomalus NRRL Y-366-8]ODQ62368.1 hypothetical protein WICANDRAFT_60428 [Wickerhamomyces anomalus NRRL Y-366-8]
MSNSYQSLNKQIKTHVKKLETPFKLDDTLLEICEESLSNNNNESRPLKPRELSKILKDANIILGNGYHRYYSTQAISQLTEQIFNLREQQQLDQQDLIDFLENLELPINLESDFKVYSIKDIIDQIENIPEIPQQQDEENEQFTQYNTKRQEILNKISQLENLKKKTGLVKNYKNLINLKIGERSNIQKNIQSSKNTELSNEITKLRINLERYKTLNDAQKEKFKQLLHE